MDIQSEIARYMGHRGAVDAALASLIAACRNKLDSVCAPRHALEQLPCTIHDDCVNIGALRIKSKNLAAHIRGCTRAYFFAATLGADVDRIIAQRTKVDSAEALCLQACAAAYIEDYCDKVEQELAGNAAREGFCPRPRFSPGYGDFDIEHQTGVLRVTLAHKRIGLAETKTHMLTPLKSVTAVIGAFQINDSAEAAAYTPDKRAANSRAPDKCAGCDKTDCTLRAKPVP